MDWGWTVGMSKREPGFLTHSNSTKQMGVSLFKKCGCCDCAKDCLIGAYHMMIFVRWLSDKIQSFEIAFGKSDPENNP